MSNQINVLLIEDDKDDAKFIKELLYSSNNLNFDITHVDRLSNGLAKLVEKKIDVTLLDLALPDCIGLSTFSKVKITAPHVPIIILTGCTFKRPLFRQSVESSDNFLVKGEFDSELLTKAISSAIEKEKTHIRLRSHFVKQTNLISKKPEKPTNILHST